MKPRLTSYYDPADPPRASRTDEANRLLGKAVFRAPLWFLYVWAVDGDPVNAVPSLLDLGGWRLVVGALVLVWTVAPLAYGLEHLLITDDLTDS
jgi:hypothetical protein